jgi:hypothetical protein
VINAAGGLLELLRVLACDQSRVVAQSINWHQVQVSGVGLAHHKKLPVDPGE